MNKDTLKIKIMLCKIQTSSKDILDIVHRLTEYEDVYDLFLDSFSISVYTNTDMYNILCVYEYYININKDASINNRVKDINIYEKIINLKFIPSEKDTEIYIVKYFSILNNINISQNFLLDSIYTRYIYLLNNTKFSKLCQTEILRLHIVFLNKYPKYKEQSVSLLNRYTSVILVDSTDISYAFTDPDILLLLINNTSSRYLIQEYFDEIPLWYIQGLSTNILIYLWYNFDRFGIYKPLGLIYFSKLNINEILDIFNTNCNGYTDKDIGITDIGIDITDKGTIILKSDLSKIKTQSSHLFINLIQEISLFNKTKDITDLYNKYKENTFLILRYHSDTNIKVLGNLLCNHKNIKYLKEFVNSFNFSNISVLDSLRGFLGSFHLVGESQSIHRVLVEFSEKYFNDNYKTYNNTNSTNTYNNKSFLLNLSFSLLLLNTKIHNPNVKTRPSFNEYISDFDKEEIMYFSEDYLFSMYTSVLNNKMDIPTRNTPSIWHYKAYSDLIQVYNIKDTCEEIEIGNSSIDSKITNNMMYKYLIDNRLLIDTSILDTPHDKFYSLCLCTSLQYIPIYLIYNKNNTSRFLKMFNLYLKEPGTCKIYKIWIKVLEKIEQSSILSKFKNVLVQYKSVYEDILRSKVHPYNINIIIELMNTCSTFVYSSLVSLLENNLQLLDINILDLIKNFNLSNLDIKTQIQILEKCMNDTNKFLCLLSNLDKKMVVLQTCLDRHPEFMVSELYEWFIKNDDSSIEAFCCALHIQKEIDLFDYIVQFKDKENGIKEIILDSNIVNTTLSTNTILSTSNLSSYVFMERYNIQDTTLLLKFYSTTKGILNQTKILNSLKTECLQKSILVKHEYMDRRLIYLILKCTTLQTRENCEYTLWIINLISSSLPVFISFFSRHPKLLETFLVKDIKKIFVSRLRKVVEGKYMCCECGYRNISSVDSFIVKMNGLVEDVEFWYKWKKDMYKEGRVIEENGEYILKKVNK